MRTYPEMMSNRDPDWAGFMANIEDEDSWTPAQPYRRVVSRDFASGCADELATEPQS